MVKAFILLRLVPGLEADFTADKIVLRFFKWDVKTQPVEAIDALQPFHTAELGRPS